MSIIQRLSNITALPTLPEVALKVQQLLYSNNGSAISLAKIIEQDQSLSSAILRVANSSFYGSAGRISSIPIAITRLGLNEVGQIVIASSVIGKLSQKSHILDYRQFWRHSLTAAYMSAYVPEVRRPSAVATKRESLYLAGLLHDIGILLYDQYFYAEFKNILNYAIKNEISYLEAERAVAPKDTHAALGAALLEIWRLDADVIDGVRFHHTPERAPDKQKSIPFAIYLSEYILCNSGVGSFEGFINREEIGTLSELKIDAAKLTQYFAKVQDEVDGSEIIRSIEESKPISGEWDLLLRMI